MELGFQI